MVCLLDRYFSDDVVLSRSHRHVASFFINESIEVRLYQDFPMYLALFYVNGNPILKELMIESSVSEYIEHTTNQKYLPGFLLEYAN